MESTTIDTPPPPAPKKWSPLRIHKRRRFLRIFFFFLRIIIHIYIFDILFNRFWFTRWYAQRSGIPRWRGMAQRFRQMAVQTGGVMIKLGQFLSARADILPAAITDELAGLQDEVPAAPMPYILQTMAEEFGVPPAHVFKHFDTAVIAAASFGQVYFGTLHDNRQVAIKVQRPRIEEVVEVDLQAVLWAIRLVKNYAPIRRRADLEALFHEFARVMLQELDYVMEAQNALSFRANFAETPRVYFPEPYVEFSTRRVLVMERITGFKISNQKALVEAGIDQAELAERLNGSYLKQFFLDGLFHADPHPGNLFVRVEGPSPVQTNGTHHGSPYTLIFVDCGMVGRLPPTTMEALREGIIGLATNDAERMVGALDQLNMILPGTDRQPIVQAIQIFMRYTYDRSVRELTNVDVQSIFDETEHLIRDLPFQIPQDLVYLGRAVSLVGGMATAIYPDINLFESAKPFAQEMLAREQSNGAWTGKLRDELGTLGQIIATLPRQMDAYYKSANRGNLRTRIDLSRLERSMQRVERATSRLSNGIMATGLFLGGVLLRVNGFADESLWAWGIAAIIAVWSLRPR
ncbi:MAG: putative unusual protein kinase regulating ubiquinone biosynthesis, AarF/ABC1/UbiB family [Chloroflexi bacterium AL-W]|nr:putative unusual protein kinase regulating ubiquinone biosynthesis, AarF/ABC1/UbiB family [Chloroflexi bacterium AL-N1]NOK71013.1 putative unusual protein kinase regulating ubiquinone biosynthesis, AarF/ABC1/UbiB family [Chloroflexi bacterium AL-N10]NOK72764.1 putative unusual protein kinase regulating ubiquinone biosynthesis, AarF/ABC1/UbiB family [Chloroflexi bacterium AL-N5]NOK79149.1 putative unusual protein kinase regulating ubiquinone biosynthesis, AarF/ABC1/UbiB family [Chloroflexi bac